MEVKEQTATVDVKTATNTSITPIETPIVVEKVLEPDLITKVTQYKKPVPVVQSDTYKDFDEITDPKAKEIAINRDKARQADYTRKTQELAVQRKELEEFKEKSKNWTADRIQQELLNNPQFLQEAQKIVPQQNPPNSGLTNEEFSTLTDGEKAKLARVDSLENQVNQLTQSNLQARVNNEIVQTDAQLTTKYADYNPGEINSASQSLANMTLSGVREYIYKATRHDEHVAAAYELGKQEALQLNKEKASAIGLSGFDANANDSPMPKNKGESDTAFFVRLAQARLAQSRRK